jgi:hypothetical protein
MGDFRGAAKNRSGSMGNYPKGKKSKRKGPAIEPGHVHGVRMVLRQHGYDVDKTGPLGDRLLSAWKDYRMHVHHSKGGKETPSNAGATGWNKAYKRGGPKPSPKQIAHNQSVVAGGNKPMPKVKKTGGGGGPKGGGGGGGGAGGGGKGGGGGGPRVAAGAGLKLIPTSMAKQIADLQFGGDVDAARQAILQTRGQNASNVKQIGDWTGQVQDMIAKGKASTAKGYADAASAETSDAAKLAAALGGNAGAGFVQAQGAAGANLAREQGANAGGYSDQMAAIMQSAALQARTNEQNLGSQRDMANNQNLQKILGEQGAAKASALMQILQQNNSIKQQGFQNNLQSLQTQAALAMSGVQMENLLTQTAVMGKEANKPTSGWASLAPDERVGQISQIMQAAGIVDPKTGALLPQMNTSLAKDRLRQAMVGAGFTNAKGAIGTNKKRNKIQNQMLALIKNQVQAAYARRNAIPVGSPGAPVA